MKTYFYILGLLFVMSSCSDFLEENITDDIISLSSPIDGQINLEGSQAFRWEELDGVTNYRMQIVSPSFNTIQSFVVDTEVGNSTRFDTTLLFGNYEWKVIGSNNGFTTESDIYLSLIHIPSPRDQRGSRMPSSA